MSMGLKFSPEIQLGHLFQAIVAAATLTGWALWGYSTINTEISVQKADTEILQERVANDEKSADLDRADRIARDAKVNASLDKIVDQLTDLRTLVAAGGKR